MSKSKPTKSTGAVANILKRRKGNKRRNACIDLACGDELMFADGLDAAIIGIADRDGTNVVVYEIGTIIEILKTRDGMSTDEAREFFDFNIARSYFGEITPLYVAMLRKSC